MVFYCFDGLAHLVAEPLYGDSASLRLLCVFIYSPAFDKPV